MKANEITHWSGAWIILKDGRAGRRTRLSYPDWWKGIFSLKTNEGEWVNFTNADIVSVERYSLDVHGDNPRNHE